MKILLTGFVVFVTWLLFSVWLYVEKLNPIEKEPIAEQPVPEPESVVVDSIMRTEILKPKDLIVHFNFDDASFIPDSKEENILIEFEKWIGNNQQSKLSITGHTDEVGSLDYNQKLGLERAQSVQNYFENKGVSSNNIQASSKGEEQPIADQTTEEGRAKSRRAVITIKN